MSRREGRDSDSKRHRSRFDREPSPKRSRRDGKPETERISNNHKLDIGDHTDRNQKHRQRLQDALPLEAPLAPDSKVEAGAGIKEIDKKFNGVKEFDKKSTEHSSDPAKVPRSRSYFQHDDRGNAGQVGQSFGRSATTDRGWWKDSRDHHTERTANKSGTYDTLQRDNKSFSRGNDLSRGNDNRAWRHDGFYEMEANPPQPTRRRPAFREKKIPEESDNNVEKAGSESLKPNLLDGSERGEERGSRNPRYLDRPEKSFAGDRAVNRGEQRYAVSRERYGGGGNYRGRDRFNGRQGYRSTGRVEKWKHDLFEESNRSPSPQNEEDQIAKVEALLAS